MWRLAKRLSSSKIAELHPAMMLLRLATLFHLIQIGLKYLDVLNQTSRQLQHHTGTAGAQDFEIKLEGQRVHDLILCSVLPRKEGRSY